VDSRNERVVWMVDDDRSFRDLSEAVALDADIAVVNLSTDELIERRKTRLPDGAMLDGVVLAGPDAERYLEGIPRIVICTGREYVEIAERWTAHPHVRVLLKPMSLVAFQDAIRWLAGADDGSSWPTPRPAKGSGR
jgi:FixJ family two-component response regulator